MRPPWYAWLVPKTICQEPMIVYGEDEVWAYAVIIKNIAAIIMMVIIDLIISVLQKLIKSPLVQESLFELN